MSFVRENMAPLMFAGMNLFMLVDSAALHACRNRIFFFGFIGH
jgi:hypothetical protein